MYWIESGKGKTLPGYMDCNGNKIWPQSVRLESLEDYEELKMKGQTKSNNEFKENKKQEPTIITRSPEKSDSQKLAETTLISNTKEIKKQAPKIELLDEKTDYSIMIKESKYDEKVKKFEITIELDNIESTNEVDLDISSQKIIVTRKSPKELIFESELPHSIIPDSASAKWSKKKKQLTIMASSTK